MKNCNNCINSICMHDMNCYLVCTNYTRDNKRWIVNHPILRSLFCKWYFKNPMIDCDNAFCKSLKSNREEFRI